MQTTVLCVDIGTTSLKAALITAEGEVVFVFRKKYSNPLSKFVALRWLKTFDDAFSQCEKFCKEKNCTINGIAVSGNGPTLVLESGLTLLWNGQNVCDSKVDEILEEINGQLVQKSIRSLFVPRILLLRTLYPVEFAESSRVFSGPEFLIYKLTGNPLTILPEERYKTAYWSKEVLEVFEIDENKLPDFVPTAFKCGFWNGIPVFAGGPDFIVALIGTNTLQAGYICDRSGSSEGINFCVNKQLFGSGIRTLPSVIPELWNCSVLIPESSKLSKKQRINKLKNSIDLLRKLCAQNNMQFPKEMTVTGGQTKNSKWMKEKAQMLKIALKVCSCSDSELLGDCCIAWLGLGKYENLQQAAENIVKIDKIYE